MYSKQMWKKNNDHFRGNEKKEHVNIITISLNYKSPRQDLVNEDLKVQKVIFPKEFLLKIIKILNGKHPIALNNSAIIKGKRNKTERNELLRHDGNAFDIMTIYYARVWAWTVCYLNKTTQPYEFDLVQSFTADFWKKQVLNSSKLQSLTQHLFCVCY